MLRLDIADKERINSVKKQKNISSENMIRMIIRKNSGIKRLNVRSIIKLYPELGELVKIL